MPVRFRLSDSGLYALVPLDTQGELDYLDRLVSRSGADYAVQCFGPLQD
jgi:hypothetical protein